MQADESPIKALDKQHKNGIHRGYMWVYHAPVDRLVLFDYQAGRDKSGPRKMLSGYSGILQTDGYTVYKELFGHHPDILLVHCMGHARWKFVEAQKYDEQKAGYVIEKMQALHKLEQDIRNEQLGWQQHTIKRQQEAVTVLDEIKKWLEEQVYTMLPESLLSQAIGRENYLFAGSHDAAQMTAAMYFLMATCKKY